MDLLRQAHPPITSHTTFAAIEAQCQADDRWQALSHDKRYLLCLQHCAYTNITLNVHTLLACCRTVKGQLIASTPMHLVCLM